MPVFALNESQKNCARQINLAFRCHPERGRSLEEGSLFLDQDQASTLRTDYQKAILVILTRAACCEKQNVVPSRKEPPNRTVTKSLGPEQGNKILGFCIYERTTLVGKKITHRMPLALLLVKNKKTASDEIVISFSGIEDDVLHQVSQRKQRHKNT